MAKDPAVLFYYQDFLVGTEFMTDSEVGQYIRILCHQADKGRLSSEHILKICNCQSIPKNILSKLLKDENGKYYNARMELEREKRQKYTESRRNNRKKGKDMSNISLSYVKHMENENENINENGNKDINENGAEDFLIAYEHPVKEKVLSFFENAGYPENEALKFFSYYSARDWETGKNDKPIKYWSSLVEGWMLNSKNYKELGNGKTGQPDGFTSGIRRKDYVSPEEVRDELSQAFSKKVRHGDT